MSDTLSIQNKEGKLRSRPSFLGKINARLPYGTKVKKLEEKSTWIKVSAGSKTGWLHKDSVTEKEIVVRAGQRDVNRGASDDELVLAGKGFSESVEKGYRKRNPNVDFAPVDRMENYSVKGEALARFIKEGNLADG